MFDVLQRQLGLLPERLDQVRPALHGLQSTTREVTDLSDRGRAQVGDLVLLQVGPDGLDGVELGRIGRQCSNGDMPVLLLQPTAAASPGCRPSPG